MSNFNNNRRGPNVSQFLRDLNAISPQDSTNEENFTMGEDSLSFFTNTEFFDLDSGQNTDFQAPPVKPDVVATPAPSSAEDPASVMGDISNMDFMNGEFNFQEFSAYPQAPSMNNAFADGHSYQPLQPNHGVYGNQAHQPQPPQLHQAASRAGDKRKAAIDPATPVSRAPPANLEEASRVAAEEDKRRRNTAASARFRVKKKQREQALEKSAKEMNDKVTGLESRVSQLETENKWLKNLLVDKNEGNDDIAALWKEFTKQASKRGKPEAVKDSR